MSAIDLAGLINPPRQVDALDGGNEGETCPPIRGELRRRHLSGIESDLKDAQEWDHASYNLEIGRSAISDVQRAAT